jgi:cyclin A
LQDQVLDIDAADKNDPQWCFEYISELTKHNRMSEMKNRPSTTYIGPQLQRNMNARMRAILISWLVEVAQEYTQQTSTMWIGISLVDRCLSKFILPRNQLQLLGCACMMLASKNEEIFPITVSDFVWVSDNTYTREQILSMELKALGFLDFHLNNTTAFTFVERFLKAAKADGKMKSLTNYLAELSLLEYGMLKFAPSLIGASAVYLARRTTQFHTPTQLTGEELWTKELIFYSEYEMEDLQECVTMLHAAHVAAEANALQAIREKYSMPKTFNVANISPVPTLSDLAFELEDDSSTEVTS